MDKLRRIIFAMVLIFGLTGVAEASFIDDALVRAGDFLVTEQISNGSWTQAEGFTGGIVAGLVHAYELTGTTSYHDAAEAGGNYIFDITDYNTGSFVGFLGDEAYGLTRLSAASANPADNSWRTATSYYYQAFTSSSVDTYVNYLTDYYQEDSIPLFYVSHHALAADYVDDTQKGVWRQSVIDLLANLNDADTNQVMGFAAAVWALAQTGGGLDATEVSTTGDWAGVQLQDLPDLLASHQVASGEFENSFYWHLDHVTGGLNYPAGYTEDTIYGILGLEAAGGYEEEVLAAREVLAAGVDFNGYVYDHLWNPSGFNYVYDGETLQALPEPATLAFLGLGTLLGLRRRRHLR
jgi:hypothetical protein